MSKWRKRIIGELSWKQLAKSSISIYLMLMIFSISSCADKLIFVPPAASYKADEKDIALIESAADGKRVAVFHLPAKDGMPTLLWSHGNAEDIGNRFFFEQFHAKGFGIVAYDYPGYGHSEGRPSENACYSAADTAFEHLSNTLKVAAENTIIVGQSVGSGPACYLAEKYNTAGLVLITPFTSIYRVAFKYSIFPGDRFPNIKRIKNISEPLMVIHGDKDELIPQVHSRQLVNAHSGESIFHDMKGRGHNSISGRTVEELTEYVQLFVDFAQRQK